MNFFILLNFCQLIFECDFPNFSIFTKFTSLSIASKVFPCNRISYAFFYELDAFIFENLTPPWSQIHDLWKVIFIKFYSPDSNIRDFYYPKIRFSQYFYGISYNWIMSIKFPNAFSQYLDLVHFAEGRFAEWTIRQIAEKKTFFFVFMIQCIFSLQCTCQFGHTNFYEEWHDKNVIIRPIQFFLNILSRSRSRG